MKLLIFLTFFLSGSYLYAGECRITANSGLSNADQLVFENHRIYKEVVSVRDCIAIAYSALGKPTQVVDSSFGLANRSMPMLVYKTHNRYTATYNSGDAKIITKISYQQNN